MHPGRRSPYKGVRQPVYHPSLMKDDIRGAFDALSAPGGGVLLGFLAFTFLGFPTEQAAMIGSAVGAFLGFIASELLS